MNLFVDANVLLGFFGLSPEELEELRKLVALIEEGDLTFWLPEILRDEVLRNRQKVLAEATKPLRESRLKVTLPELSKGLGERQELESAVREAQRRHSALLATLDEAIAKQALEADHVINELFQLDNTKLVPTAELMQRARDRRDLRRPPGKADSLGDALNWEALLEAIPYGEDIHLVSADGDYRSPLADATIRDYLSDEWRTRKNGEAYLYRDLGSFSKKHFPALDLATDVPKLRAINQLASSSTFAQTHAIVARLADFDIFTPEQARLLLRAAAENSQVRWIARDEDVYELLHRVIEAHRETVDPAVIVVLEREMHPPAASEDEDDDLPF